MSIERAYSAGWGIGEKVTGAQLNALDLNPTYGIDKRNGKSDWLGSVVQATGGGRIISTVQTGPDANITFQVNQHNAIVRIPTLTAARKYTLGHSGVTGGDRMFFYVEGTGSNPSGYVDIANNLGTGMFRLGMTRGFYATGIAGWNDSAQGDACEAMFIGSEWKIMQGGRPGMRSVQFTSSAATDWICPPGVFEVFLIGYGGGGGGAAGAAGYTITTSYAGAGAGGGGSWPRVQRLDVVPGRTYEGIAGSGGAGGSSAEAPGSPGSDSVFREKSTGNVMATFRGADFGTVSASPTGSAPETLGFGGGPVRITGTAIARSLTATGVIKTNLLYGLPNFVSPSTGGFGTTTISSTRLGQDGFPSADGYAGGTQGAQGTSASSYQGGGGGGGGGAGPGGAGGNGGAGGAGKSGSSDSGDDGADGTAGAANTGAGGGGGGGGGAGQAGGGSAGLGGAGGSGKIVLVYFR